MRSVYLDHAATTPVRPEVLEAMQPYFSDIFGNPSSLHLYGQKALNAMDIAREQIAQALGCGPMEVYFTSGGTESDNLALQGAAFAPANRDKKHIITSAIEHHAVLHTSEFLEKVGFEVTYLPVDAFGRVALESVEQAIRPDTLLVSIMYANNEVGTVQPIAEIGALCRNRGVLFHTDAVQAMGTEPIDVNALNVDLLSFSGHKIYGPKGMGVLYAKKGVRFRQMAFGGAHERNKRAGTENLPGIVGLAKALELAVKDKETYRAHLLPLQKALCEGIESRIPYAQLNGHPELRIPGNVNYTFEFVEGESMLLRLDRAGIAVSTGSACTSHSLEPSHVLQAMNVKEESAHSSLRMSMGRDTSMEDVQYTIDSLESVIRDLRAMSPLYNG